MKGIFRTVITGCFSLSLFNITYAAIPITALINDSLEQYYRLDFAIPQTPASEMIDLEPSNILRPSTVREFTTVFSDWVDSNSSLKLPDVFGVEISPFLMFSGKHLSLTKYQKNPFLYRTRVSVAFKHSGNNSSTTEYAFGIRATIFDDSDLRTSKEYINNVTRVSKVYNAIIVSAIDRLPVAFDTTSGSGVIDIATLPFTDDEKRSLRKIIDSVNTIKQSSWNKNIWEIALGGSAFSPDTLDKTIQWQRFSLWTTYGLRIGKQGQLLIGGLGTTERDSTTGDFSAEGSLSTRLYLGANDYKFFGETQFSFIENFKPAYLLNSGVEIKLRENIWITLTGGLEYSSEISKSQFLSNLDMSFGIPLTRFATN